MQKLVPHSGLTQPPFKRNDRVKYIGSGMSVAHGTYGDVRTVYQDSAEVIFSCGTLLITQFANLEKVEVRAWAGYYGGYVQ